MTLQSWSSTIGQENSKERDSLIERLDRVTDICSEPSFPDTKGTVTTRAQFHRASVELSPPQIQEDL